MKNNNTTTTTDKEVVYSKESIGVGEYQSLYWCFIKFPAWFIEVFV